MSRSRPVKVRLRGEGSHDPARRLHASLLAFLCALAAPRLARAAEATLAAPASGDQLALSVRADAGSLRASACSAAPCAAATGVAVTVPAELAKQAPSLELVDVGKKRHAVHVRWGAAPSYDAGKRRWEAQGPSYHVILSAPLTSSAEKTPLVIHQGWSDRFEGVEGERRAERVELLGARGGPQQILVGELREDLTLCGRPALLSVRALDAATLALTPALFQRLSSREQSAAARLSALPVSTPAPGAVQLSASGATSAIGKPSAASDGDLETSWSEARGKAGTGEFITFRAPSDVELGAFELAPRPSSGGPSAGAAPKQLFLVSTTEVVSVELPADAWATPGARYRVDLPKPWKTSCVGLVLGEGPVNAGNVDVTVAELVAVPTGPGASPETLIADLEKDSAEARRAVSLLAARGAESAPLVIAAYESASPMARGRVLDVLDQLPCEHAAPGYASARADGDEDLQKRASQGFSRCKREAPGALSQALGKLGKADVAREARLAAELSVVDPARSVEVLVPRLVDPSATRRRGLRAALAEASRSPAADAAIQASLADAALSARATVELMRSLGDRIARHAPAASAALARLTSGSPSLDVRYLSIRPAAYLAEKDPAAEAFLSRSMVSDPSPLVRSASAEVVSEVGTLAARRRGLQSALLRAVEDDNVRVRAAAARSLGAAGYATAQAALRARLLDDAWPLVRIEAAEGLGALGVDPSIDESLATALEEDESPLVRARAARALGRRGASAHAELLRDVFSDSESPPEVRREAATALGALCDAESVDELTEQAEKLMDMRLEPAVRSLSSAALRALGRIHPEDLASRLRPFTAKQSPPPVHALAQSVLDQAEQAGACRKARAGAAPPAAR